jgi:Fe-S cluster biogenesis protein NfuA
MIKFQGTPNPNALKFITNRELIGDGQNATFKSAAESADLPLAKAICALNNVTQVYFFENTITVTQDGTGNWEIIAEAVKSAMEKHLDDHDSRFHSAQASEAPGLSPELVKIDEILDRTVRAHLQGDGGDLAVLSYTDHHLYVRYQGACGGCPSAAAGTLQAIQGILRDEFDPEITVIAH